MKAYLKVLRATRTAIALVGIGCLLAGCGSIWTTISTYRSAELLPAGASFHIVPDMTPSEGEGEDDTSSFDQLEFDFFAQKLAARLVSMGFEESSNDSSDLVVTLVYDVERQKRNDPRPLHFYSRFGYFYRYGSIVVIDETERDLYEFIRKVKIKIERPVDGDEAEQMLSLTALSKGQCQHLPSVYDGMLDAIFANFYRANGSVIRMKTRSDGPCEGAI